ncbi:MULTISPECIES: hypothetical protein [Cysteiniphilum]|uniref:Uncharacterized protein n=1 Tax=Cysteiniphilum litorale TaxID=2056700 RepID=A0A8J2Z361_9GAMM|nr:MULTISPECIES: hypothetical protein [Cysteiniphilum]GGF92147.1 hypothetical protein GCM10010995_06670 [Cysteiniphilum litorale]
MIEKTVSPNDISNLTHLGHRLLNFLKINGSVSLNFDDKESLNYVSISFGTDNDETIIKNNLNNRLSIPKVPILLKLTYGEMEKWLNIFFEVVDDFKMNNIREIDKLVKHLRNVNKLKNGMVQIVLDDIINFINKLDEAYAFYRNAYARNDF